jgi:hypothetical protein
MTDYRRNFTAECGFFFEWRWDVQQGDGFRKGSTHPTGYNSALTESTKLPAVIVPAAADSAEIVAELVVIIKEPNNTIVVPDI